MLAFLTSINWNSPYQTSTTRFCNIIVKHKSTIYFILDSIRSKLLNKILISLYKKVFYYLQLVPPCMNFLHCREIVYALEGNSESSYSCTLVTKD